MEPKRVAAHSRKQMHEQPAEHHEKPRAESQPHLLAHRPAEMVHQGPIRAKTTQSLHDGM
jgi:hypothetical protein